LKKRTSGLRLNIIILRLLHTLICLDITEKTAEELRLTKDEFELIKQKLGRTPNFTELCAFSGMWSEHCSYKNSIKWLKTLPRSGGRMLVSAGEENAGLMDIGNGWGLYLKSKVTIIHLP
jgi:phosphoribosylformylglycinamidine synthase